MKRQVALAALVPLLAACGTAAGVTPTSSTSAGASSSAPTASSAAAAAATTTTPHPHSTALRSASPVHLTESPSPAAKPSRPAPAGSAVGALFTQGLDHPHGCTATVVASASGDVVMTAAHCVSGDASGVVFVPAYDSGSMPYGSWQVTGAYAPDGWLDDTDSRDDVAFLTVAPHGSQTLQATVGAVQLGSTPADGDAVAITAYNIGTDQPVQCATRVHDVEQDPTIFCGGFAGGSSGSAWVTTQNGQPTAVGLIGGLHQGGCTDATSYSPPFDGSEAELLARIGGGDVGSDDLPTPPGDGC